MIKRYFLLSAAIVVLDQWTKHLAVEHLLYASQQVTSFFSLILAYNQGAAFSFLSDAGGWQRWFLSLVALVVSAVLIGWMTRLQAHEKLLALALALVLGGAIGNVYDRIMLGYVVDFIAVHYEQHYFPTFNVADSAISIGALLLLIDAFLQPKPE